MIPLTGGSFLNAEGGDLGKDTVDERDDVERLEVEIDVAFRRRGGGESGCIWATFPRSPEHLTFFAPAATLGRGRGGGVSPPSG